MQSDATQYTILPPALDGALWRKSSRSVSDVDCVELAQLTDVVWRKSVHSGSDDDCVELAALANAPWRKSRRSGSDIDCVELAPLPAAVGMRDSKNPADAVLVFAPTPWQTFAAAVQRGEFDPAP